MVRLHKTSQAVIKTARLNPIHPTEREVLQILNKLSEQGYKFKDVIVDAVLRADGKTPEMFAKDSATPGLLNADYIHQLVTQAVKEAIKEANLGGPEEDNDDSQTTSFARNFAQGFMARQKQILGDEFESDD